MPPPPLPRPPPPPGLRGTISDAHRQLRRSKCTDYWRNKVEANESDPRQLWQLVDDLLGRVM